MTLEHDLLKLARDAMRALMNGREFAVGQTGHYLNIISRIEAELSRHEKTQQWGNPKYLIEEAVLAEREACAKLCDIHANNGASFLCAAAIRARGNHNNCLCLTKTKKVLRVFVGIEQQ